MLVGFVHVRIENDQGGYRGIITNPRPKALLFSLFRSMVLSPLLHPWSHMCFRGTVPWMWWRCEMHVGVRTVGGEAGMPVTPGKSSLNTYFLFRGGSLSCSGHPWPHSLLASLFRVPGVTGRYPPPLSWCSVSLTQIVCAVGPGQTGYRIFNTQCNQRQVITL